jgi:hypothetical protein
VHVSIMSHAHDSCITGSLPGAIISKLERLEIFSIQHNIFQGEIPLQILGELKHLREVWFTNNYFHGDLHNRSIGKLQHVTHFSVHKNELTGTACHVTVSGTVLTFFVQVPSRKCLRS